MRFHGTVTEAGPHAIGGSPTGAASAPLHVLRVGAPCWPPASRGRGACLAERRHRAARRELHTLGDRRRTARIDTSPVAWADVVVFALPFCTVPVCLDCGALDADGAELVDHALETGHVWRRARERLVRGLVLAGERDPGLWLGRGLVVELREDPMAGAPAVEWDLLRALLTGADEVIAAGPGAAAAALREGVPAGRLTTASDDPDGTAPWTAALRRAAAARAIARGSPGASRSAAPTRSRLSASRRAGWPACPRGTRTPRAPPTRWSRS